MSIKTPTTSEISQNIVSQLELEFNQSIPLLPKSFIRVLAKVLSGVFILLYKYGGFIFLQMFVRTASADITTINGKKINPLLEWGRLIGVGDPGGANNAELLIEVTVEKQTGFLLSNTQLVNSSNGVTYITIGSVELNAPTVQATIKAVSDQSGGGGKGVIGNLSAGDEVSFANPIANVAKVATVISQSVTGAEAETTDAYRQRIIDRFQKRPQGGAYSDYELWGEEAAGIINVYPYTGLPGQVDVYSEATIESSGNNDGIPTEAQLQSVLDVINYNNNGLANRRSANAFVNSLPITRSYFNVKVNGIIGVNDLAQVRTDITQVLSEYFWNAEPFIVGLSIPPRKDIVSRVQISALVEDVVTAAGGTFTSATFSKNGEGQLLTNYFLTEGEKAKLGDIDFL